MNARNFTVRQALRDLKDGDYWVYGPAEHEFEFVIELIQRYSDHADSPCKFENTVRKAC